MKLITQHEICERDYLEQLFNQAFDLNIKMNSYHDLYALESNDKAVRVHQKVLTRMYRRNTNFQEFGKKFMGGFNHG